jgi:tetratricopeptide (TPR) repeat protein
MRILLMVVFFLFLVPGLLLAQGKAGTSDSVNVVSNKPAVFTDSMEEELYSSIKEQGQGHSEAEIEQTMGVGLLDADNQWKRAEKHFKKAINLDPKLYWSWYNLGLIYIDSEVGMEYFRKAIETKPDYAPPYYWLAYNYARDGKFNEAFPTWEKYLKVAKSGSNKEIKNEKERIKFATEAVKEIRSGKQGEELEIIHIH